MNRESGELAILQGTAASAGTAVRATAPKRSFASRLFGYDIFLSFALGPAPLIMACCSGNHFKEAMLTVRKAGEKPLEYLKISLKDILITSQSTGSDGGDRLAENITLNFAEFKVEYKSQKTDGSVGATYTAKWNYEQFPVLETRGSVFPVSRPDQ